MEKHHRSKFFTNFVLVAILLFGGLLFLSVQRVEKGIKPSVNYAAETPVQKSLEPISLDFLSPDGTYILTFESGGENDGLVNQKFYISSKDNPEKVLLYETDSEPDNLLSVPDNTFSPNHKYFFLKSDNGGEVNYLVFKTNGSDIPNDEQYVEVTRRFYNKYPEYKITDITGWGGVNVLVVNTDLPEGKSGPSWWFDATSLSFIKLSLRFN